MVAYSFKRRFVTPIRLGLGLPTPMDESRSPRITYRPKQQTIRANGKRRHARPSEELQLYCAMRTKQCFLIGRSRCTDVVPVYLRIGKDIIWINVNGKLLKGVDVDRFARTDGFEDAADMLAFWQEEHGLGNWTGSLIVWEPIVDAGPAP